MGASPRGLDAQGKRLHALAGGDAPREGVPTAHSEAEDGRLMRTEADLLRLTIEACGDLPKRANADTGWFAVEPHKWERLIARARREGRDGPNLVVYRTKT